jgi:hypothetical protein
MIRMPMAVNTAVNFASRSRIKNFAIGIQSRPGTE